MEADQSMLESKLSAPLNNIIDKHRHHLLPLIKGKSSDLSRALLRNDETVRTVATYCYTLLPGIVRVAVKEPTFVAFVMTHREQVLGKLLAQPDAAAGAATPA